VLERWQADCMKLHFGLLHTRDELWEYAERFDGEEFKHMLQSLCKALKPLGRLLAPDATPDP
jgi:hypothetical protein